MSAGQQSETPCWKTRWPKSGLKWRPERHWLARSEEHTSELQSRPHLVCRLLLEKKKKTIARSSLNQYARNQTRHTSENPPLHLQISNYTSSQFHPYYRDTSPTNVILSTVPMLYA